MKKFSVKVKGVTPVLMSKPEQFGFDQEWIEKVANTDDHKDALKRAYVDTEGKFYQPAIHFERSLIEAGKKLQVKGHGKATYSKLFGSMLSVEPAELIHKNQNWEVHKALVVIPSTKGRVMRYRPMIKDWEVSFEIVAEDELPDTVIKEALEIAGKYSGIGDWRPEKKGKFGKFQTVHFEKIS